MYTRSASVFGADLFFFSGLAFQGESDREDRPFSQLALNLDAAIVMLDRMLHDRKPQTGTTRFFGAALINSVETLEDLLLFIR